MAPNFKTKQALLINAVRGWDDLYFYLSSNMPSARALFIPPRPKGDAYAMCMRCTILSGSMALIRI